MYINVVLLSDFGHWFSNKRRNEWDTGPRATHKKSTRRGNARRENKISECYSYYSNAFVFLILDGKSVWKLNSEDGFFASLCIALSN